MDTSSQISLVKIENFQAIEHTEIPMSRLTVITGPGDAGKSAILRALRAVFLNDAEDADIRHGASRTKVELSFTDGMSIEWWKDKGKGGCYRFAGTDYTKTGGAVPEPIADYLQIRRIEVDATTELTPQISDQHDAPFILWETGSKRARIIGKATRLDMVVTAQMRAKSMMDKTKKDAASDRQRLNKVTGDLTALPDTDDLERRTVNAQRNLHIVRDSQAIYDRVRTLSGELVEVRSRVVVDVAPARQRLETLNIQVAGAIRLSEMAESRTRLLSSLQDLKGRLDDNRIALGSLSEQYLDECAKSGVCPGCGGLLDHKECKDQ